MHTTHYPSTDTSYEEHELIQDAISNSDLNYLQYEVNQSFEDGEYRPVVVAIIEDKNGNVLFVKSAKAAEKGQNNWGFPQGGIDRLSDNDIEHIKFAVLREVQEETGISPEHLQLMSFHGISDLDYPPGREKRNGFSQGKRYFWFKLIYSGPPELQLNEELAEFIWVPPQFQQPYVDTIRSKRNEIIRELLSLN